MFSRYKLPVSVLCQCCKCGGESICPTGHCHRISTVPVKTQSSPTLQPSEVSNTQSFSTEMSTDVSIICLGVKSAGLN
jgi:hypothetical protein